MKRPPDPQATIDAVLGAQPEDEHPALDVIVAYHADRLPALEEEAIREHLAACPSCASQVIALSHLRDEPALEDLDPTVFPDDDVAWDDLRSRLGSDDRRRPVPIPEPAPAAIGPAAGSRTPWALAATLVLAILGLGIWVANLRDDLASDRRPQLGLPIVDLLPEGWARGGDEVVRVGARGRFVLILNPPSPPEDAEHDIEIVDAEGKRLWLGSGLRPSEAGNFFVELSRHVVPVGTVTLRILRDGREVAAFDLRVEDRAE